MIASSRPVYSPTRTVVLEVPISTAPMKVVLELTFGLGRRIWKLGKKRRGLHGGGRLRRQLDRGGRFHGRRIKRHRHFATEGEIDFRGWRGKFREQLQLISELRN